VRRGAMKLLLKAAVSGLLIWLLLSKADLAELAQRIAAVGVGSFIAATAVIFFLVVPAAFRWRLVLARLGQTIGMADALRITLVGLFFNQVLPSSVGGDAVRMWQARHVGLEVRHAVNGVLIDRVIGLSAVFLMTAASLPRLFAIVGDERLRWAFVLVAAIGVTGIAALAVFDRLGGWMDKWRATRALADIARDYRRVLSSFRTVIAVFAISVFIQASFAMAAYILARSLNLGVSALDCLVLVPPVVLVMAVPVSIAGWGLREGAMIIAFGFVGVDWDHALALSVLLGATSVLAAAPGGLLWLAASRGKTDAA
jgi:glycosyltransferase 2 family protein